MEIEDLEWGNGKLTSQTLAWKLYQFREWFGETFGERFGEGF